MREVEVENGTTIFQAAKQMGIDIPALCYMKLDNLGVENRPGGCRICVVEVEGRRNLAPSCSTVCTPGMVVHTHTMRVINARRTVLELILSDHPKDCLICPKNGRCELAPRTAAASCRIWLPVWASGRYIPLRMRRYPPIRRIRRLPSRGIWTNA